jgi:hypothetical protein
MRDGVVADVSCVIDVEQVALSASGKTYTKADIISIASSSPEMFGAIKYAIKDKISDQLSQSFPDAIVSSNTDLPSYQNQQFHDEYVLLMTSSFFDLNRSIESTDFINGMMDVGFIVNYSFSLNALKGWNNSYTITLPNSLTYKRTTGKVIGQTIQWEVKNWDGNHSLKEAEMSLYETLPTISGDLNETIDLLFRINCRNPDAVSLEHVFSMKAVNLEEYNVLPAFLTNVNVLPSDAIRLCVQSGLLSWNSLYERTLVPLNSELISYIEDDTFNQTLDMVFSWDNDTTVDAPEPYNWSHMDNEPPVIGMFLDDDISLVLCDISSKAMFGLINAGAEVSISNSDVNLGQSLDDFQKPYTGIFLLPTSVYLNGSNMFQWDENSSISGSFSSTSAEPYKTPLIDSLTDIEVTSTDLNLLSFFTGKTELTISVYIKQVQKNSVIPVPSMLSLPSNVNISLLNADALRLCILEGVFSPENVADYLENHKMLFKNLSRTIVPTLKGNAQSDNTAFEESLSWDGNVSTMDGKNPVEVVSYMHSSYPLTFHFSLFPPSFDISSQNLTFTGVPNENVTYTMIFPSGVSINVEDTLNRAIVEKVDDRVQLIVSFNSNEGKFIDVVSCRIHPSFLYIIGMFTPCILSIIITIILFIVVYLIQKKRNSFRGSASYQKQNGESDFEGQDYYVPPPPPSSR